MILYNSMEQGIIMLAGLPGTGKSTVGNLLKKKIKGYDLHSLFEVRQYLGHKKHRPKQDPKAFEELYRRTKSSLKNNRGVIIDNTYTMTIVRKPVYDISKSYDVPVLILECVCSEKVSKRRMKLRSKNTGLFVEPRNPKVYDKLAYRWEPLIDDLPQFSCVRINYIKYDSENRTIEKIVVWNEVTKMVHMITQLLTSERA